MAPKKDKQKIGASQSSQPKTSETPTQTQSPKRVLPASMSQSRMAHPASIVPYAGHPPVPVIPIANRFTSLGTPIGSTVGPIRPNYQSALVSDYDPFAIVPPVAPIAQTSQSSTQFRKSSPYFPKDKVNLFIIEPLYEGISDPITIIRSYFPPNSHFFPPAPYKDLKFYRDILHETKSVEIKPIKDRDNPAVILYHSLYIQQILSQAEFSPHPYELKYLKSTHPYTYADYIDAWYNIFLHQTVDFSHSWLINFDAEFKSPFPYWFLHWWDQHGPTADVLPIEVHNLTNYYASKSQFNKQLLFFPKLLLFIARYKIPWIMKWNYHANWESKIMSRQYFVKWWDKFSMDRISIYVFKDFPQSDHPPKPSSPTGSVSSAISIDGKSKAELRALAAQLLDQASQMNDDEDNESSPSASSCQPGSSSFDPNIPFAQDPYDAYDLGSD
ncbi:hypothetical protein L3X38_017786 [Prunus dulcis]|uniref:Uncharacterized protein n=1 Tax=Prunus dulcis TaxID=3755 RepID=A0AAD4ZA45_PRUDU|nr:hypothetical protein L3X38_017786 [Prunus dulcis]